MVRKGIRRQKSALAFLIAWCGAAQANGGSATDEQRPSKRQEVVFEVFPGPRPEDASDHLRPLEDQLERAGWAATPSQVASVLGARRPRSGRTDPTMTVAKIRDKLTEAQRRTTGKDYDYQVALELYEQGFRWALENQALVGTDLNAPRWLTDAYVGYAKVLMRTERTQEARKWLRRQSISFPDVPVTDDAHGPWAAGEAQAVRQELDAEPHGTLLVAVDHADTNVFFNFAGRGRGGTFYVSGNAVADDYEVLIQVGATALRYVVSIDPSTNEHAELRINWALDAAMAVTDDYVAIAHASGDIGVMVAKKLPGLRITLLSIVEQKNARGIVATSHRAGDGKEVARCVAKVGSPGARALKDCLVERMYQEGVYRKIPTTRLATTTANTPRYRSSAVHAWIALGSAAATMYFGGLDSRDGRLGMGIAIGIGAASLAYMTYRGLDDAWRRRATRPALGVGVGKGGGMLTIEAGF
jgi:hypothetical protein